MSIINDALNKAGNAKLVNQKTGSRAPSPPSEKIEEKSDQAGLKYNNNIKPCTGKKKALHNWVYFLPILAVCVLALFALFLRQGNQADKNASVLTTSADKAFSPTADISYKAADTKASSIQHNELPNVHELSITGIVHGEGAPMAIINDSVYMAGDMIGDLKVVKISKNAVSLEKDGKIIELRVK
jgi:hypothetical protein